MLNLRRDWWIGLALVAGTLALYWHGLDNHFVDYDDGMYVRDNSHVIGEIRANQRVGGGLTAENVRWAFSNCVTGIWHPLTWLSLQFDFELYGPQPRGFHFTNVLLHCLNTLLLFVALRGMSGAAWPSAATAALFAWHPLHVESVAWISERKDVISAFFWMLAMVAYGWYVRRPSRWRIGLVTLCLVLGLMAKPMLVTLPFVFLLLDYWPLGRMKSATMPKTATGLSHEFAFKQLIVEKAPLFFTIAAGSVLAWYAQQSVGAVHSLEQFPLKVRFANACAAHGDYLRKMAIPIDLAAFYPHPGADVSPEKVALSAVMLLVGTAAAVRFRRQAPYLTVGWFWYLGTLVPVIGIVQIGDQALADRYTYIPFIGIFIALSWGMADLAARWVPLRALAVPVATVILGYFAFLTWYQVSFWLDSQTLWVHAIVVTNDNYIAYHNLATVYEQNKKYADAERLYRMAVELDPNKWLGLENLGNLLGTMGRYEEAKEQFELALQLKPHSPTGLEGLGNALTKLGRKDEAVPVITKMFLVQTAQLAEQGKFDDGAEALRRALKMTQAAQRPDLSAQIEPRLRAYEKKQVYAETP